MNWHLIYWNENQIYTKTTKVECSYSLDLSSRNKRIKAGWYEVENNRQETSIVRDDVLMEALNGKNLEEFEIIDLVTEKWSSKPIRVKQGMSL